MWPEHPSDVERPRMQRAIITLRHRDGDLPARGWRCRVCGEEALSGNEAARVSALAKKLGLNGPESEQTRKLVKTGSSLAVTLDPAWLREIFGDEVGPGVKVRVAKTGDRIVVSKG